MIKKIFTFIFLFFLSFPVPLFAEQGKNLYKIGIGDKLFISVWKNDNLAATVTVRPDGMISFFLTEDVHVAGLTSTEVKRLLTDRLKSFLSNPEVTVIIDKTDSNHIYILGEVVNPGKYHIEKNISLLHTLSLAGGIKSTADIYSAFLLRKNNKVNIDFYKLLYNGDLSQNITLMPYDLLYFPNYPNKKILIFGEVNDPKSIPYRKKISIMDAILQSGGMSKYANPSKIRIIRDKQVIPVDFLKIMEDNDLTGNVELEPNDLVIIPKSLF